MARKVSQPTALDWGAPAEQVEAWSSGNVLLDWVTGCGGLPKASIVETYGPESSGKSTLAFQVAAHVWKTQGIPSWLGDMEHAFDPTYGRALGLDPQGLKLLNDDESESLESMLAALHLALEPQNFAAHPFALWIVDSVAACACLAELGGGTGVDLRTMGMEKARIWSDNLRRLLGPLRRTGVTLVLVNQLRDNVDISGDFVPPGIARMRPKTKTPGGRSLKFYARMRIEYEPTAEIKEPRLNQVTRETENVVVGKKVWLKVTKNKVAPPPWRKTRLEIRDGMGFDLAQNLLEFAVVHDIIDRKSGVYTFPAELSATGAPFVVKASGGYTGDAVAAQLLRERPGIREALTVLVMERLNSAAEYVQDRPPVDDIDAEADPADLLELPEGGAEQEAPPALPTPT